MKNRLDEMIAAYTRERNDFALLALHKAFMSEKLQVPISEPVKNLQPGQYDVPVICIRTENGVGAIPAFTATEHLLKWKPHGCLYASLSGRSLLKMALGMEAISEILVNPNDVPRGRIPRTDFEAMLALQ